jgi:hypothetical protein
MTFVDMHVSYQLFLKIEKQQFFYQHWLVVLTTTLLLLPFANLALTLPVER